MRRRVASFQYDDDDDDQGDNNREQDGCSSSIRVINNTTTTTPSSPASFAPYPQGRGRSWRKAVPLSVSEENQEGEVAVIRAGNILMQQVALQAQRRTSDPSSYIQPSTTLDLLPPVIVDRHLRIPPKDDKARYSDQPFEEREEEEDYDEDDAKTLADNPPYSTYDPSLHSFRGLPQLTVPAPTHGNLVPPPLPSNTLDHTDLISSLSASSTLAGIGRSLQWSQKFPQGRHLSRAKSRTTLRSVKDNTITKTKLTEARAGLRLLAKRRQDVIEEQDDEPTRVAKWNRFKWVLFFSVLIVFIYSTLGVICSLLTWAEAWNGAKVSVLVDTDVVILLSVASSLCLLSSMVGLSGTILNSRPILALYAFLLWPSLLSMLTVGYTSYKRNNFRLDLKLNQTWSRYMDDLARLRVQEMLRCCGYYSPLHQATFSRYCYPRTTLPGCKGPLYRFEKRTLAHFYTVIFTVVFLHLAAIAISLLCANHVNVTFGKGLTPRAYRLDVGHVRRNAVNIIRILASSASEQTDTDVHHLLQVDKPINMEDSSQPSYLSRDSLERWKG